MPDGYRIVFRTAVTAQRYCARPPGRACICIATDGDPGHASTAVDRVGTAADGNRVLRIGFRVVAEHRGADTRRYRLCTNRRCVATIGDLHVVANGSVVGPPAGDHASVGHRAAAAQR